MQDYSLLGGGTFIGLANYVRAFQDPQFIATLGHVALFAGLSLVLGFGLPIGLAIYLNEVKTGQSLLRSTTDARTHVRSRETSLYAAGSPPHREAEVRHRRR